MVGQGLTSLMNVPTKTISCILLPTVQQCIIHHTIIPRWCIHGRGLEVGVGGKSILAPHQKFPIFTRLGALKGISSLLCYACLLLVCYATRTYAMLAMLQPPVACSKCQTRLQVVSMINDAVVIICNMCHQQIGACTLSALYSIFSIGNNLELGTLSFGANKTTIENIISFIYHN